MSSDTDDGVRLMADRIFALTRAGDALYLELVHEYGVDRWQSDDCRCRSCRMVRLLTAWHRAAAPDGSK